MGLIEKLKVTRACQHSWQLDPRTHQKATHAARQTVNSPLVVASWLRRNCDATTTRQASGHPAGGRASAARRQAGMPAAARLTAPALGCRRCTRPALSGPGHPVSAASVPSLLLRPSAMRTSYRLYT